MGIVPTPESDRRRFWAKVDKHGPVPGVCPERGPCWVWTGALFSDSGYAAFRLRGKQRRAHIVSYEWHIGPVGDLMVCHHCDVRRCVRPEHLFRGTNSQNILDAVAKGRAATGGRNGMHTSGLTKLTEQDVRQILDRVRDGEHQDAIAVDFGITQNMVSRIVTGKAWGHLFPDRPPRRIHKRLAPEVIVAIRELADDGVPYPKIASTYGCSTTAVWRIATRIAYADLM